MLADFFSLTCDHIRMLLEAWMRGKFCGQSMHQAHFWKASITENTIQNDLVKRNVLSQGFKHQNLDFETILMEYH